MKRANGILPTLRGSIEIEPVSLTYALEGLTKRLELEVLEGGFNPTHDEHDRMAALASSVHILAQLLGSWRDEMINKSTVPMLRSVK